jgi:hypothetical protein
MNTPSPANPNEHSPKNKYKNPMIQDERGDTATSSS